MVEPLPSRVRAALGAAVGVLVIGAHAIVLALGALGLVLGLVLVFGCATSEPASLAKVVDVTPRDVEVGDRVEILGYNLPSGNLKGVTVTLRGELRRPGQPNADDASKIGPIVATPAPDKVSFTVTEGLQARICGQGDRAAHTTFHGDVTVTFPPQQAGMGTEGGVRGVVKGITLDFRPPSIRRLALAARESEARDALSAVGIGIDEEGSPKGGGLLVASVTEGRAAAQGGVHKGDLLLSFNGVTVTGITDLIPPAGSRVGTLGVKRGASEAMLLKISTKDVKPSVIPNDVLAALVLLLVAGVVLVIFMAPTAGIITWFERRVAGRMQSRIGPNRAGPQGVLIWLADGLKSFMKEDVIPRDVDKPLFRLAPYLVFTGVSATFVVMPFGQYLISADLDIGILFIIAVTSLVAIGLLTGGWASNNKWSLIGGIRAAAQVISYEIPSAIAIVCVVMMTGSLRMQDIIGAQGGGGTIAGGLHDVLTTGGWPWYWYVCRNPVSFALFFLLFTTALAEGNRTPFDLPEAESELVAGYSTEYSGMRYVFFYFAEWANVFVMSAIASALFLGGWQIPGVSAGAQEASIWLQVLGALVFLTKSWILIFVVVWVRWTLPRIRVDQLMAVCWKWLVPLSFAGFALTGLWVLGTTQPIVRGAGPNAISSPLISESVQLGIGIAMFAVSFSILVHFARRVHYNLKNARVPIHVNPFL